MLLWLSGTQNTKWSPNENYGRELMELFTLGAGRGYTERDVREQARALTGFENDWKRGVGVYNFRFEKDRHDAGNKRIFGKTGPSTGRTPCGSASTTSGTPPSSSTSSGATSSRRRPMQAPGAARGPLPQDFQILPVVDAILRHPALFTGPRMVKPPAVYTAGLLRALGRGVDTQAWAWLSSESGQRLFMPPNVSGWDDERWLDTATFRGRWEVANYATQPSRSPTSSRRRCRPSRRRSSTARSPSGATRRSGRRPGRLSSASPRKRCPMPTRSGSRRATGSSSPTPSAS